MWKASALLVGILALMVGLLVACGDAGLGMRAYQSSVGAYGPRGLAAARDAAPGAAEELWVIQKPMDLSPTPGKPARDEATAELGSGALVTKEAEKTIPLPLKHTDVKATIAGYMASTRVRQEFHNPFSEKIEAVYVFPLPENAAVNEFVMNIGERKIRGVIREREEARKVYEEAKHEGYVASLLSQERPNVFMQHVANIEPGKQIDIDITYYHTMTYTDGYFEYVFPMVVGPRYNPAGSTDGIGAVGRGHRGVSGQKTEVQYLKPGERSGHDIAVEVEIHDGSTAGGGVALESVTSVNHQIRRRNAGEGRTVVQLDPADTVPNKDFVLRYRVAGDAVKTAMFVQPNKDGNGGYFTLMLVPPAELKSLPRRAMEMVFVIDTSGSMDGRPLDQAKKAATTALDVLRPEDSVQVVRFAGDASQMSDRPLPASGWNVGRARNYITWLSSGGGTEMLKGINAALDFAHDENRTRVVTFLTDGYIGNEAEILQALHGKLADSRVFSFGVGSSVNRYLLNSMATLGNGTVAYLSAHEDPVPVMKAYMERISHPALTNIKVESSGIRVHDAYPQRVPDLFVGTPVVITGRYDGTPRGEVSVVGFAGAQKITARIVLDEKSVEKHAAIRPVWARMKIADLSDQAIRSGRDVSAEIRAVAIEHSLMSQYTSFVAVDESRKTEGGHGTTVAVPVPVPDGVRYETTVEEGTSTEKEGKKSAKKAGED